MTVLNNADKHYWSFRMSDNSYSDDNFACHNVKHAELHPADIRIGMVEQYWDALGLCGLAFFDDLTEVICKIGITTNR
jgi:hypothetical protein